MKTTKIAMIGVGDISGIYLENITAMFKELEIYGVCDLIREKAERAKEKYNIPKIYKDMREAFADPQVDIILNLTRPYEHFGVSSEALKAGKHVYTEKPLGASYREGKELIKLAEENNVFIGGAADTYLGAGIQTCRKIIDDGWIGDPVGAACFMICRGHESWHPDPEFYYKYGGGPMLDMGPYYVSALINLLGGVESIIGIAKKMFKTRTITSQPHNGTIVDVDINTHVTGLLNFENGALGTIITTFDVVYDGQARFEVYGSKGTITVPDPNGFGGPIRLLRPEHGGYEDIPLLFGYKENSRGLGLADMAKAIITGRDFRANGQQLIHVLEILDTLGNGTEGIHRLETKYKRGEPMKNNPLHGILD
jgi:predicted dehydrogenase